MNIEYGSTDTRCGDNSDLTIDNFGKCKCGKCERAFLQKRTIIKLFEDFIKRYKKLPIDVDFFSIQNGDNGYMKIEVAIEQTGDIMVRDLKNALKSTPQPSVAKTNTG